MDKAKKFKHQILQGTTGRYETIRAYKSIYKGRIAYSLGVTAIQRKQLDKIQNIVNPVILSQLGYNKNMLKAVLFGPIRFGGIGMIDLFTCQGTHMVTSYLFNTRAKTSLESRKTGCNLFRAQLKTYWSLQQSTYLTSKGNGLSYCDSFSEKPAARSNSP
jgi:hypothetical protein